jgi:phosphotransacetylase
MDHLADDLRNVSAQHGVHVAKAVADVDGRYVHMAVMTTACGKIELVAGKLETVDKTLRNMLTEDSPPREAQ